MTTQDVNQFRQILKEGLTPIDKRLGTLEEKADKVESRLGNVETKLGKVETKLEGVENKLEIVERKVDALAGDVAQLQMDVKGIRDHDGMYHTRNKREIDEIKIHLGLPTIPDSPEA